MKKYILPLALALGAPASLIAFGLLYYVGTSPAQATQTRVGLNNYQPSGAAAMLPLLKGDYARFVSTCPGVSASDMVALNAAMAAANSAVGAGNDAGYNTAATSAAVEMANLRVKYRCAV